MKTILHLCADLGSDSRPYQLNSEYKVILIGKKMCIFMRKCADTKDLIKSKL